MTDTPVNTWELAQNIPEDMSKPQNPLPVTITPGKMDNLTSLKIWISALMDIKLSVANFSPIHLSLPLHLTITKYL